MAFSKPSSRPLSIEGTTPSAAKPSPYIGLASSIGSPAINQFAKTAAMAQAAASAPKAPKAPKPPIHRIKVRQPRFAKRGAFTLPPPPSAY